MARLKPITSEQRAVQREFFQLDEQTIDRVRRLKPRLMRYAEQALETVFDHLLTNPEVAHYFEIGENITYLRAGMLAHCDKLFSARYDDAYYEAADLMGERHSKLEYLSHVYTAAYANMFTRILELATADRGRFTVEDVVALTRVTMYDMELSVGSFFAHRMEKRDALDGDAVKIRHLIDAR
jgi:hypothetical protein